MPLVVPLFPTVLTHRGCGPPPLPMAWCKSEHLLSWGFEVFLANRSDGIAALSDGLLLVTGQALGLTR